MSSTAMTIRQATEVIIGDLRKSAIVEAALPEGWDVDRFLAIVAREVLTLKDQDGPIPLEQISPESVIRACSHSAETGIPIGRRGYLIPYKNRASGLFEVQFIAGYQGMIDAAKTGDPNLIGIHADVVQEKDHWEYSEGSEPILRHTYNAFAPHKERGNWLGAYAIARFKGGGWQAVVLSEEAILKVKNLRTTNQTLWKNHPRDCWKKTAVRRLSKFLRQSPALARLLDNEEELERAQPLIEVPPSSAPDDEPSEPATTAEAADVFD